MPDPAQLQSTEDQRFRAVCAAVVQAMDRLHVPGVVIGIVDGDAEHTAGFGVTNIEHPLPVDADTLFQIGSTTKTVTATVAMRLVEQGRLDLDVPVRTYLPDLRLADEHVAANVTLRKSSRPSCAACAAWFKKLWFRPTQRIRDRRSRALAMPASGLRAAP